MLNNVLIIIAVFTVVGLMIWVKIKHIYKCNLYEWFAFTYIPEVIAKQAEDNRPIEDMHKIHINKYMYLRIHTFTHHIEMDCYFDNEFVTNASVHRAVCSIESNEFRISTFENPYKKEMESYMRENYNHSRGVKRNRREEKHIARQNTRNKYIKLRKQGRLNDK